MELNPDAGQFIGIDLDAREIHGVSVDFAQRRLREETESIKSDDSVVEVLQGLKQVIESVRDPRRALLGIGLAMPGTIDRENGVGMHYQYIRGWKNVPLIDEIAGLFGVRVSLENNVRTMALAERWFGQARDLDHAICIGIRSGIGSGAIIDGELYRGPNGFAGEIGGWPIVVDGKETTLEEVASLRTVLERLASAIIAGQSTSLRLIRQQVTCEELLRAAESRDPLVLAELHLAAVQVARAIVQIVLVADPHKVIVCGPLASLQNAFVTPLCEAAEHYCRHRDRSPRSSLRSLVNLSVRWVPQRCRPVNGNLVFRNASTSAGLRTGSLLE